MITAHHKTFYETFGYLVLPGLMAPDIAWIIEEFEAVWRSRPEIVHDGSQRTTFPETMITMSERLSSLIEDPRLVDICSSLLGDGYTLYGGDGNFYSGDTAWHSDCGHRDDKTRTRHLKIAFYLDPVQKESGALRVVPGSHLHGDHYAQLMDTLIWECEKNLGVLPRDLPCAALETMPGDLVVFDHRLKHASFGGSSRRRMFTTNWLAPMRTPEERESGRVMMRHYWDHNVREAFRPGWFESSPPERQRICRPQVELWDDVRRERATSAAIAEPSPSLA